MQKYLKICFGGCKIINTVKRETLRLHALRLLPEMFDIILAGK